MNFRALIQLGRKTATGIEVPPHVLGALGGGQRPRVAVTLNGYTYRTSVGSMGGRSLIPVSQDVRTKVGVRAGDAVTIKIELDTIPRVVDVPADLESAMARRPASRRAFDQLTYSARHRYVYDIERAKTAETRHRRVLKAVDDLLDSA